MYENKKYAVILRPKNERIYYLTINGLKFKKDELVYFAAV